MKITCNLCYHAVSLAIVFACFLLSSHYAQAQRTMKGQNMLTVSVGTSILRVQDCGAEISFGQYLLGSYWFAEVGAMSHRVATSGHNLMRFMDMLASGGYMHRLVSNRSRSLSLYAGGGAFLGYEIYDPMDELPESISTGLPSGTFLYGISPRILAEVFITGKMALTASCSVPVNFTSPITKARPDLMLGLRLNL